MQGARQADRMPCRPAQIAGPASHTLRLMTRGGALPYANPGHLPPPATLNPLVRITVSSAVCFSPCRPRLCVLAPDAAPWFGPRVPARHAEFGGWLATTERAGRSGPHPAGSRCGGCRLTSPKKHAGGWRPSQRVPARIGPGPSEGWSARTRDPARRACAASALAASGRPAVRWLAAKLRSVRLERRGV